MEKITSQAITELLEKNPKSPAVTIYCPMHKSASPPHMTEEQIRFKNLVHKAALSLKQREDGRKLEKELCDLLEQKLDDQNFWEEQTEALLICAQPGVIRMFNLPVDTEEYVAVDDNYHLAPILSMLQEDVTYYVLSVAQHAPKLYRGDMYGLTETELQLPETAEKALNIDEVNQKSEHARSASGPSQGPTGFHGRGGARDPREEDRARFFRMIDNAVCNHIGRQSPLILAGIDAETAEFRQLSRYPKILDQTISGSFSSAKPNDLFVPAYEIVRGEIINSQHSAAIKEYQTLKGANPDRVASHGDAITAAAEQGRIDKLLINILRETGDTIRDNKGTITRITFPELAISASLNRLANRVWQTSGKIIGLDAARMPDGALMLARLRY